MKKYLHYSLILILLVGISIPTHIVHAQNVTGWWNAITDPGSMLVDIFEVIFVAILKLMSYITWLSGYLMNYVLKYTIVDMRANIVGLTGINIAWKVIRDLMNIAFIFMLVYEGILLIVGQGSLQNVKKFITGIVLASILINFSLFFTKVLIDASNLVTIGFYNSAIGPVPPLPAGEGYGLSDRIVRNLGITNFYSSENFGTGKDLGGIFVMGFGSGLILLITAFIFFAITILFVIRYVTLIILLMLSPVAYMGMALPFMQGYARQWWDALRSQLLFAPIYMIMTWIVLTLLGSNAFITTTKFSDIINGSSTQAPPFSTMGLILNFAVIIGLLIASLITAKTTATKGSSLIGNATGKLSTFAGNTVMGGGAWAGRKTIGNIGANRADNAQLQEDANTKKGFGGAWARTKLYTARTARDATFDVRNASVPTNVAGDLIGGTVGRTRAGKALGLNDVNIPSIAVGAPMANLTGVGKGGTKGYAETKQESEKRVRDGETANATELALAQARKAVTEGAKTGATPVQIDAMEKALSKLSDKQTESLVASDRELLNSLNFANTISVKQLEAINKSDQFSDTEKDNLKNHRFAEIQAINDPAGLAALAIPAAARTPIQITDATRVETARGRVKGLSDSEIEMLDTTYLTDPEFVSQLRPAQFESIAKSNKFTSGQKKTLRETRVSPLLDALDTARGPRHAPNPALVKRTITKGMTIKDVAGLMGTNATFTDHTGTIVTASVLTHPEVLNQYSPNMLKRMGQEMTSGDIQTLRDVIEDAGTTPGASPHLVSLATWLGTPDGNNFS